MTPTEEQKSAIEYNDNMVIIAKPGSGKTFVISEKIKTIIKELPDYKGVIAISYTNKASRELKNRVSVNGLSTKLSCFSTVDSFYATEIIFPFLKHIFGIPNSSFDTKKIKEVAQEESIIFPECEDKILTEKYINDNIGIFSLLFLKGIIPLETYGALALYTLKNSISCRRYIQKRYSHIFIDEYQDTDKNQYDIFLFLESLGLKAIAVGDADQSIFEFSGKRSIYLLELAKNSNFKSFSINYNHRSHPSIINYANLFISSNPQLLATDELRVYEKCGKGDEYSITTWLDERLEKIKEYFNVNENNKICILTSNNDVAKKVGSSLQTKNRVALDHPLESSKTLTSNIICLLLRYYFDKSITAEEIIDSLDDSFNNIKATRKKIKKLRTYDEENIQQAIINSIREISSFEIIENDLTLLKNSSIDSIKSSFDTLSSNEVQIMTMHKSKGLEFDIVFIYGLYDYLIPFQNIETSESKNLHYVAITRAKKACFLCYSTQRHKKDGNIMNAKPSSFLLKNHLKDYRILCLNK